MKHYHKLPLETLQSLAIMDVNPLRLYLVLCFHANFTTGECWPSKARILSMTKISNGKRLKEATDSLTEWGFIDSWLVSSRRHYRVLC